jgi:signal transduction histidine kinase
VCARGGGERRPRDRIETSAVAERPGWVRLVIRDAGPGISPEELSKVFDPLSTKKTGTGLNLSTSYGIIEDHHGTVDAQCDPGQGTTFILAFPRARD